MEGTTEPIVVVIGHPIAGNPSQFALERSLHAMKLDWRVLSFDVQPDDVAAALEGFAVTGIVGVLVDSSVAAAAGAWYAQKTSQQIGDIDCLHRDEEKQFVASNQQLEWLRELACAHGGENRVHLGEPGQCSDDLLQLIGDPMTLPPDVDVITAANQIFIAGANDDDPVEIEIEDWPEDDGSTLVIDLTDGHPQCAALQRLGFRVLTSMDRRIGTLQRCLQLWSGETPPVDVIHDAIEEYLAV